MLDQQQQHALNQAQLLAMQQHPLKLASAQSLIHNHLTGQTVAPAYQTTAVPQPTLQSAMTAPPLQNSASMNGYVLQQQASVDAGRTSVASTFNEA